MTAKQKKLQDKVDRFNLANPVGAMVHVRKDNGEVVLSKTTAEASLLGGHTPVVWLDGISGCYDLSRVTPVSKS